jgi:hypothetical protein
MGQKSPKSPPKKEEENKQFYFYKPVKTSLEDGKIFSQESAFIERKTRRAIP